MDRKLEIIQCARELIEERGLAKTSVAAITERMNVARTLFYHYFPSKEDLVAAVLDTYVDEFIASLKEWNAQRVEGDIEGALDTVVPLFKRLVASGHELPSTLTSSSGALYGGFLHNVVQRVAQYICDTTVVDFVAHHELRIDHVYETFYTLIMGLLMYIRTHPDVPDETVKEIIASTLHIEGYTAKYPERKPQN